MIEILMTVKAVIGKLFVAVGPIENGVVFAGLTHYYTKRQRFDTALKACLTASIVLVVFPVAGDWILRVIDLPLWSLKIAGGILLIVTAMDLITAEFKTGEQLAAEHADRKDLSVFPLGIPLIAGPATISLSMGLVAEAHGEWTTQAAVILAILILMAFSFVVFLVAGRLTKLLGESGAEILSRTMSIILASIGAAMVIDGVKLSEVLGPVLN